MAVLQRLHYESTVGIGDAGAVEVADPVPDDGVAFGVVGLLESGDQDVVRWACWVPVIEVADQALEERGLAEQLVSRAAGPEVLQPVGFVREMEANGLQFVLFPDAEVGKKTAQGFGTVCLAATLKPVWHATVEWLIGLIVDVLSAASRSNVINAPRRFHVFWMTHVIAKLKAPKGASDAVELYW